MNLQAFQIIETLGLKHPKCYSLEEAIESERDKFYLRYGEESKCQSRVVNKKGMITQINELKKDLLTGKLLEIEDSYEGVAGCAVYSNLGEIYGEYVSGHIVALLRKGLCDKRFFIGKDKDYIIKDAFQEYEALQVEGGYEWKTCENKADKLNEIIAYLSNAAINEQKDLLLEMLITENDIVVCDAKNPGMEESWQGLKNSFYIDNSEQYLKAEHCSKSTQNKVKVDGFDIDDSRPAKNIIVVNGAFLSHYITRNYSKYNSVKIIQNSLV